MTNLLISQEEHDGIKQALLLIEKKFSTPDITEAYKNITQEIFLLATHVGLGDLAEAMTEEDNDYDIMRQYSGLLGCATYWAYTRCGSDIVPPINADNSYVCTPIDGYRLLLQSVGKISDGLYDESANEYIKDFFYNVFMLCYSITGIYPNTILEKVKIKEF